MGLIHRNSNDRGGNIPATAYVDSQSGSCYLQGGAVFRTNGQPWPDPPAWVLHHIASLSDERREALGFTSKAAKPASKS